jgi:hypothetical protein
MSAAPSETTSTLTRCLNLNLGTSCLSNPDAIIACGNLSVRFSAAAIPADSSPATRNAIVLWNAILNLPLDPMIIRLRSQSKRENRKGENMSDDGFNMSLRKFLKTVGVTSQQEIEEAVRTARDAGNLPSGAVTAKVTLTIGDLSLSHEVTGQIEMPKEN